MKIKNVIITVFPAILMSIIIAVCFANMDIYNQKAVDFKGILLMSMFLLFPVLFLIQGILSAKEKINIIFPIGVSVASYLVLMIIYLNETAAFYVAIYLVFWIFGYVLTKVIMKVKGKKHRF